MPSSATTGVPGSATSSAGSWTRPPPPTTASSPPARNAQAQRTRTVEVSPRTVAVMPEPDATTAAALAATRDRIRQEHLAAPEARPASSARGLHHTALVSGDVERTVRVLPGAAGVPADRDDRQPRLRRLDALLLRHRQRQPAGVLRLPRPGRRPVRRGARRPAPRRDQRRAGPLERAEGQARRGRRRVRAPQRDLALLPRPGRRADRADRRPARARCTARRSSRTRRPGTPAATWAGRSGRGRAGRRRGACGRRRPRPRPPRGRPSWRPRRSCRARGPCRPRRSAGSRAGRTPSTSWMSCRCSWRGSPTGTQSSFSSGPASSVIRNIPSARTRIRQPGKVGSSSSTRASSGSPSPPRVSSTKP